MSVLSQYVPTLVSPVPGSYGVAASDTELGYVHGVTSAIQTQMDLKAAKASPTFTGTVTAPRIIQAAQAIAASAIDWSAGNIFSKTLAASVVFTFTGATAGQWITVIITGDSSHTVTWPTVTWRGGVAPVQTLSKVDIYSFFFDGTTYFGSASQNY